MTYNILVEKEYKRLSLTNKKPHIGCLMMVKNEEKRIHVSLNSVTDTVDCLIIYDTGSTDKTIEIITTHCEKHKLNLYMISGDFVNFATSRNVSLDYADTKNVHFLLLLDTNDELQNGDKLKQFALSQKDKEHDVYLMCQHWWSGKYDKYFNTRFLKARCGWRYRGAVHEYLDTDSKDKKPVFKMPDDIILYQDRTQDDDKTGKRFKRDKELLLIDYEKNPTEPRCVFYLAQTCSCLGEIDNAYYYYKIRTTLQGFQEEIFHAFLRCGELSEKMNHDWYDVMPFYMKAFEHSKRVEPLIHIVRYYISKNQWLIAYTYAKLACSLEFPHESILFIDKYSYDYTRWHLLGIVAFYCGQYTDGKNACLKAIDVGLNVDLDKKNLKFYEEKEANSDFVKSHNLTKSEFIKQFINNLDNQNISKNKLQKLALSKWKQRNN